MKYTKFYRYLLPFWKGEALVLSLSGLSMVLSLTNPYLTKLIIDKAYENRDLKLFIILVVIGAIIFIANGTLSGLSNYLSRYIRLRIKFDLNIDIFRKLQALSCKFFQDKSTGEHLYKINYDIDQASRFIADMLPQAIFLSLKSLFIFVIIVFLNWKMALLTLTLVPFLYIMPYYFNRKLREIFKMWIENSQAIFKKLHETLSHIQLVKVFGREKSEIREYIRKLTQNTRLNLMASRLEVTNSFVNSLASRMILGVIIFYGGYQVINGRVTLGSLTAITIYLTQLSALQNSFVQFFQQISLGGVSCERLEAILDAEVDSAESAQAKIVIFSKGKVRFGDVTFGYSSEKKILDNLSFCIEGNSCLGLVGPSGCGKTTIVNLIMRLYRPEKGEILIDGRDIKDIKSESLYKQIGVVLQEPYLWNDTIENNIRYGKEDASLDEIKTAAKIACIDDFVNSLPQRYAAIIGENACKISEGQKQRIAIARAVIKRPKILILDEALSSVDAEAEARIVGNIRGSLGDSTIIVVSHRFSTIKKMDLVYFLTGPSEIAIGAHEELAGRNIKYRNYLADQLKEEIAASFG